MTVSGRILKQTKGKRGNEKNQLQKKTNDNGGDSILNQLKEEWVSEEKMKTWEKPRNDA